MVENSGVDCIAEDSAWDSAEDDWQWLGSLPITVSELHTTGNVPCLGQRASSVNPSLLSKQVSLYLCKGFLGVIFESDWVDVQVVSEGEMGVNAGSVESTNELLNLQRGGVGEGDMGGGVSFLSFCPSPSRSAADRQQGGSERGWGRRRES